MTQVLDKKPLTRPFVDMKMAVQDALKQGLEDYKTMGVMDWEVKVLKADPQGPVDIPAISIVRISDSEVNQVLGDMFEYVRDKRINKHIRKYGTDFMEAVEIKIWSTNSDQRDLLYSITKAILFDYRHFLALKYGLVNQRIASGRDEANHIAYEPHFMYWGVLRFEAENSLQRSAIIPTITKLDARLVRISSPVMSSDSDDFSDI